jgi:hypothetical protein
MQGPIPAGLALVIELVLDSPTTRAPTPGQRSSDPAEHGDLPLLGPPAMHCPPCRTQGQDGRRPGVVGAGRGRSGLGPHRIGSLWIRAGSSGHDGYEEIAGRSILLPMTLVARPAWRQLRIPPPLQPSRCYGWISTSAAITTQRFKGSAATPIAVRACRPTSSPDNSTMRSENPLMTPVVWP